MPTLDDLTTLPTATLSGNEFLPVADPDVSGGTKVRKLPINAVMGLAAGDVKSITATPNGGVLTSRLSVVGTASTTNVSLPLASGSLREIIIMRPAAATLTVDRSGTDTIVTASSVSSTTATLVASSAGRFLSDGTKWYHVSNDA